MGFTLTDYINRALSYAKYDKLDDGSFTGRIPKCKGVIAFAKSLHKCEDNLRATLEDWILLGLKLTLNINISPKIAKVKEISFS